MNMSFTKKQNNLCHEKFLWEIINGLLEEWDPPETKQGRSRTGPMPMRMTGQHFPDKYINKHYKPDCVVCSHRPTHRRQTTFVKCHYVLCHVLEKITPLETIKNKSHLT